MNININSSSTDITQVTVDGNTDIQTVNVDGTDVWFKAPTALESVQGLYDNWNTWIRGEWGDASSSIGSSRSEGKNSAGDRYVGCHTETFSSYTPSLTGVGSLGFSPTTTTVFIQYGHDSGTTITTTKVNGSSTTAGDSIYSTLASVKLASTTSTKIGDVTSTEAYFCGSTDNKPSYSHSMLLPGQWSATDVGDSETSSATVLQPGDILITPLFGNGDGNYSDRYPSQWVSGPTLVMEKFGWWYRHVTVGVWVNKTSSNVTATWTSKNTGYNCNIVRLRHTGI
jgi:hypothetical protein